MHKSIKYYNTDFHNDGYSIMMSEKYFYFRKKTKTFGKNIFSHLVKVTGSIIIGNIFRIMCCSDFCKIFTKT